MGGFCVGYGIMDGQYAMGEATMSGARGLMIIGGGIAIVGAIIMEHIGNNKKDNAVDIYNKKIANVSNSTFSLGIVPTEQGGIALAFNF